MTLIILIMAGIIIGGPYVIRSWNAQMKSWDDSVIDSFRDPLADGPPVPITGCAPQGWVNGGCDVSTPNPCNPSETITCGILDRLWKQSYTPAGCACDPYYRYTPDDIVRCTPDTSCCTPWADVVCGVNASPPCPDGQMQQTRTCDVGGVPTPEIQCVDDASCVFTCLPDPPPNGTICPGSDTGLTSDTFWTFTDACVAGEKCKIYYECGDAICNGPETCLNCQQDCPAKTISVQAFEYDPDSNDGCRPCWTQGYIQCDEDGNISYRVVMSYDPPEYLFSGCVVCGGECYWNGNPVACFPEQQQLTSIGIDTGYIYVGPPPVNISWESGWLPTPQYQCSYSGGGGFPASCDSWTDGYGGTVFSGNLWFDSATGVLTVRKTHWDGSVDTSSTSF